MVNFNIDYVIFSDLHKKYKIYSLQAHYYFLSNIENNINCSIQSFWKYIISLRSNHNIIPSSDFLDNVKSNCIKDSLQLFVTLITDMKNNVRNYNI